MKYNSIILIIGLFLLCGCSSENSTEDEIITNSAPSIPSNVLYSLNYNDVAINWDESVDGENDYVTYELFIFICAPNENCDLNAFSENNPPNASTPNTNYTFSNLENNTNYVVGLRALDENGNYSEFIELNFQSFSGTIDGDVYLKEQSDVDEFLDSNVEIINGSIFMLEPSYEQGIPYTTPITDLSPISGITEVNGDIELNSFGYHSIDNLNGFESITIIGGTLRITNFSFDNINGLINLSTINGIEFIGTNCPLEVIENLNITEIPNNLILNGNYSLTNISGFESLTTIGGQLEISDNHNLNEINGFNSLTSINSSLNILNNQSLTTLHTMTNLSQIGGDMVIKENEALYQITNFNNLNSILGSLNIEYTDLSNLNFLYNLLSIGNDLWLSLNDQLLNIDGLASLNYLGNRLSVIGNDSLTSLNFNNPNHNSDNSFSIYITSNDNLINISGLSNLVSANSLFFANNENLQLLDGLNNLQSVANYLTFIDNDSLNNLNFLSNLVFIDCGGFSPNYDGNTGNLLINGNFNLTDLCGLTSLFSNSGLCSNEYKIINNGYNPTHVDIINGNCNN